MSADRLGPPPLSMDELRELKKSTDPTVRRLLWEIFRLQIIARHVERHLHKVEFSSTCLVESSTHILKHLLDQEPVIQERRLKDAESTRLLQAENAAWKPLRKS